MLTNPSHDDIRAIDTVEAVDAWVSILSLIKKYIFCTASTCLVYLSHTKKLSSPANISLLEFKKKSIVFWPSSYFIYSLRSKYKYIKFYYFYFNARKK